MVKRKTGDELQSLPKALEQESETEKRRVNPPRSARMEPVVETAVSELVLPKKTRAPHKKKVPDLLQAGLSRSAASAAKKKGKLVSTTEELAASVKMEEGWLDELLALSKDDLAKLLADIANHGNIKTAEIKKARSFSGAKWRPFAESFGLPDTLDSNPFEQVSTPVYCLPPSIHEAMFQAAWHTQDVYQERQVQRREEARVRIMDSVCQPKHLSSFSILRYSQYLVPIIGLFQGRVVDKPEQAMLDVEHEVRIT